ncbi:MAG: adenylate/guanylate cyclase domain-containing protein [Bacteroidia bacterium]
MLKYAKLYAAKSDDSPDLAFQKQLLAIIAFFLTICGTVWSFMYYSIFGPSIPFYAAVLYTVNAITMSYVSHIKKNHLLLVYPLFYATFLTTVAAQWASGSFENSGMVILWGFLMPLGLLIFTRLKPAIFAMTLFVICILITALYEPLIRQPALVTTEGLNRVLHSMNIVVSFTILFASSAWFVHIIKMEKRNSDDLLLNILPKDVAEELKKFGKVEPVSHDDATVLFTDFKGFTEISESISPKELVEEINHCFAVFDEITTRYHIEKIKTIGDSYMAVGGDFGVKNCPPVNVVSAGMEMRDFIKQRKKQRIAEGKFAFEMRAGVHTGPVISGVVGVKKFQFDIWGDTVNIASRMESNGAINELNISETTYELIKDDFAFEFRGLLPVKGKQDMPMYFVKHKIQG